MKKEFSIMPNSKYWSNERYLGSERHEVFEGRTGNRDKSIEDGLVIFTSPQIHRTNKDSIHLAPKDEKWIELKRIGQKTWQEYYDKTEEDFRKRYGRSYL